MRVRSTITLFAAAGLVWLALPAAVPRAQDSPIIAAMRDELKRSMADLRFKDEPPPYYIAYEVDEMVETNLQARLGAVVEDGSSHVRVLQAEVRVGDYTFDSSRFVSANRGGSPASGNVVATLDENYDAMRRQIWLATDVAYKRAVTTFARKKATFQNRGANADLLPDFSKETPVKTILQATEPGSPPADWPERVRQMSAVFLSSTDLQNSDVTAAESRGTQYYLNSEGFEMVAPIRSASLRVSADTQTADGTAIRDAFSVVQSRLQEMPPVAELLARTRDLAARLTTERTAPIGEDYTGPILVEGDASAQLMSQALVPLMLARRPPDSDANGGRGGQAAQNQVTPFLTRIGLRVLPDAFSVSDTPSLKQYAGTPVPGAYVVDDEGVPAKDVTLVENGKLVTLLTGRTPQKKLPQSNGHGRSGSAQAGVFQMRSSQAVPASELKKKYLEVLKDQDKEFGYIVRGIGTGGGGPGGGVSAAPVILQVVKVTPNGAEQPVRGLRFAPIPSTAFRNILEASDERALYSYLTNAGDPVSVIVPSVIFEELEVQQTRDIAQKPPIVLSPLKN